MLTSFDYTDTKISGGDDSAEKMPPLDAPAGIEFDALIDIERTRTWLSSLVDRGCVAIEGQGGDNWTYQVLCGLRDLGLSPKIAFGMLMEPGGWNEHCVPPWAPNELAIKVRDAYRYGKNAPGACATFLPPEWQHSETVGATTSKPVDKLVERFRGRWPDEYE